GRPWLRLKTAASLDGRTALRNGVSQWITGEAARRDGHRWRARSCAVMVGIGTLLSDNPRLTVRDVRTDRQPLRIVIDRSLAMPLDAKVLDGGQTLVAYSESSAEKMRQLEARGATLVRIADDNWKVDLVELLRELGRRELNEILVESGNRLNGALLRAGLVDELIMYVAPHLLGDDARGMFDLGELTGLEQRLQLAIHDVRRVGADWRMIARVA
ncbi:MAG: bifunctional diaminohydroxyphosphoribosylaminopyrimidine deaminase/5-amino-6-(5-phosphoribosylamino)uracil reductase RibD, partial [Betaproteobacteria bacterium]